MTTFALRPPPRRIARRRHELRRPPLLETDAELISVAGAVGSRVVDSSGKVVGRLDDLVVHWSSGEPHPPRAGAIVRSLGREFVPPASIAELRPDGLLLRHTFELRPVERKSWLVALAHDVLDTQIVDVDGADVVRVSDLVLGRLPDGIRGRPEPSYEGPIRPFASAKSTSSARVSSRSLRMMCARCVSTVRTEI
jgi:hypothetical protein